MTPPVRDDHRAKGSSTSSSSSSSSSRGSRRTDDSFDSLASANTALTSLDESPRPSQQLQRQRQHQQQHHHHHHHHHHAAAKKCVVSYGADARAPEATPEERRSRATYASSNPSVEELFDEPEEYGGEEVAYDDVPQHPIAEFRASTAQDFATLFPSQKRLTIRHDETTLDGNMNLRVDTEIVEGATRTQVQLFHLRMQDLRSRQFSLRRYCRDSGREICHSSRRYVKPASERPGIQRSMSNALASLRSRPEIKRAHSTGSTKPVPHRHDSGYGSHDDDFFDDDEPASPASEQSSKGGSLRPTNTTKLDFSNYAQVDLRRRGTQGSKRYSFEYWGTSYAWRRVCSKSAAVTSVSYHLVRDDCGPPIALIVPELLSRSQMRAEEMAGGWVPPCSMWITDPKVISAVTDVADVIVATGLIALVDDCIKRHFNPKPARQVSLEFLGPKALVEHVFRRRNSADKDRDAHAHKQSPLRFVSPIDASSCR